MNYDDELYREVITDHSRDPHNKGRVDPADFVKHDHNPLCGDEIEVSGRIEDGRLTDIAFEGRGCSISMSAASMMTGAGVSRLVVARILNHVETGVTAVYDRHSYDAEKRAAGMPGRAARC